MSRDGIEFPIRNTIAFFAVTLLLSIGIGLLIAAGTRGWLQFNVPASIAIIILWSPAIAAVTLTVTMNGRHGLRHLFAPLAIWRVPIRWYLVALLLPPLLNLSAIGLYVLLGGTAPTFPGAVPDDLEPLTTGSFLTSVVSLSLFFSLGSLAEEIGWRGYALPRLQTQLTALSSSLIIGVIWASWHIPSFFLLPDAAQAAIPFLWYIPSALAIAIIFTWLFNNTGGSLLLATIFHAALQVTNILLPNTPSQVGDTRLYGLNVLAMIVVAVVILLVYGYRNLSHHHSKVAV